ncbi:MAG: amidohydrolase [Anaerolineae bacterium SM23_ 63]|nr:MAG: amidohydrolase [Anaerolineae bacterium SM23_ 63]HEY47286.1 amidohydrolase family protein [Anaerolineae bacterium]
MPEVDHILTHATIVTMDDDYRIIPDGAVAVLNDKIFAVGSNNDILATYTSSELIDCSGKTMIPGLINTHTHAAMTLLRGLEDDRRLDVWLLGYIMPVEKEFVNPNFCRLGTQLACAEMIRSGVTCFADMYYFEDSVAEAVADAGLRAVCAQTVLKFPSPDADSYEDSLSAAREFIQRWSGHPLITPAVAPHAAYTTTPDIITACTNLAKEFDVPLLIHIAETLSEVEQWREQYDMPVVPWVKKLGLLEAKVVAAHCVHIDEGEIHTLEHAGSGVAHNPSSNLKLASGFAPVTEMLETGLNVGVATDGPASNNDLDLFEEMRLATFIAKAVTKDPTALPARQVFEMATSMGAKALHLGHLTGSLVAGKRADLILVDLETTHNSPHFARDPEAIYSRLVYATKSTDVTDVMVNGKWLMRDRELLTLDEERLLQAAAEIAQRIDTFLIEREGSVLSKLIAIGGARQEESYEVQVKVRLPDPSPVLEKLNSGEYEIVRTAHYLEYDTYFSFDDPSEGRLRYREDEFIDDEGNIFNIRYRLTLTGPLAEHEYPDSVLLSRSRFIAPAQHSSRFYHEYFNPTGEIEINKDRLRWLLRYQSVELFVNIDRVIKPELDGCFLEIKSRTWSRRDAELKAEKISELLRELGVEDAQAVPQEYPDFVSK